MFASRWLQMRPIALDDMPKSTCSYPASCGKCNYCRRGMYSHCVNGGWILGNSIDGTQAEYVRTPRRASKPFRCSPNVGGRARDPMSRCGTVCRNQPLSQPGWRG